MTNPSWLEAAARRSGHEAWTLGHVFARYRDLEERSIEELAADLGCSLEVVHWLSLCRRPARDSFSEDVTAIANRFQVDPQRLGRVIQRVQVMDAFASASEHSSRDSTLQLAARDRTHDDEKDS